MTSCIPRRHGSFTHLTRPLLSACVKGGWLARLHAVIFMLRKVESTSGVNRGSEPCQSGTVLTFLVLCLAYTRVVSQGAVRAYAHADDDHYLTRTKFNSLLTEMITPQTYIQENIYIHIKPLPVPRVFGARSGSPRIIYNL